MDTEVCLGCSFFGTKYHEEKDHPGFLGQEQEEEEGWSEGTTEEEGRGWGYCEQKKTRGVVKTIVEKKKKDFVDSAGTDMNSHNFFHANMRAVSLPVLYRRHADAAKFKEECNNL